MKRLYIVGICLLITIIVVFYLSFNVKKSYPQDLDATVSIQKLEQGYELFYEGKPFKIKGVAGYTYLRELKKAGGNTIRTWGTDKIDEILDSAQLLNIKVIVGLSLPLCSDFDYGNQSKTDSLIQEVHKLIEQYNDHPSILMWGLGNEVIVRSEDFFSSRLPAYRFLNQLSKEIKSIDSNHPITTTQTFSRNEFIFAQLFFSDVDILSFNLFGNLKNFNNRLSWNFAGKPLLISEWGIDGPWEAPNTFWGAPIENSSFYKSQQFINRYDSLIPKHNPHFTGVFLFFWGQKFEITPTWFSTFTPKGAPTQLVQTFSSILGNQKSLQSTKLEYILLNNQGANSNILITPQDSLTAVSVGEDLKNLHHSWEIRHESITHRSNLEEYLQPKPIPSLIQYTNADSCQLVAPSEPGAYRLYVYVTDTNGYVATANIPFYVIRD